MATTNIIHTCDECHTEISGDFCADHPKASVSSVVTPAEESHTYFGVRTYENGMREESEIFHEYNDLLTWLCEDLEAGVAGYCDNEPVDQIRLVDDLAAWAS